jgi:hypothetical protein
MGFKNQIIIKITSFKWPQGQCCCVNTPQPPKGGVLKPFCIQLYYYYLLLLRRTLVRSVSLLSQ